jgi:hypothetical protein
VALYRRLTVVTRANKSPENAPKCECIGMTVTRRIKLNRFCSDNAHLICIYSPWAKSRQYEPEYRVFGPRAKSHLYEAELYDWTSASLTLKWLSSVTPGTILGIASRLWCDSFLQNLLQFISHTIVRRCECTMYS